MVGGVTTLRLALGIAWLPLTFSPCWRSAKVTGFGLLMNEDCQPNESPGQHFPAHQRLRASRPTLDITGPPNGLTQNHKNCASAAPVHVVVRRHFVTDNTPFQMPRCRR
jgi:hypothetical protein